MAGESILIVDDSRLNLKLVRVLLQSEGYLIRTASEGNEALSILGTFKPRLVLMDIQLPGIDGLEVTRRIKANPDAPDIIVVALTSSAMKGDEEKARSAGCDGYISKPFESRKLLSWIREYLDAPRPVQELHVPGKRVVEVLSDRSIALIESDPSEASEKEPEAAEVVDRSELWSRVDGNARLLHKIIGLFFENYPRLLSAIQQAVAGGDPEALGRAAHTLKGEVGNFAAKNAFAAALRLEKMGCQGDLSLGQEAASELEHEISLLRIALTELEQEIASSQPPTSAT